MELRNKTILIISPNYWGKMMVSKHHYALELAKRGNLVYFLNPPNLKKKYFEINQLEDNLYLIDYKPLFRGQRFLPGFAFNLLVSFQAKFIQKKIKKNIDLIWSFDSSIYLNLKFFKASYYIYFIADNAEKKAMYKIAQNADLIISVSENLFDKIAEFSHKQLLVEHGLPACFLNTSEKGNLDKREKIKAAFVGNLFKIALDRKTFKAIIKQNIDVDFIIYGALLISDSNLSGNKSKESIEFIEFLKCQNNVVLKGIAYPEKLSKEMQDYDLFLFVENPLVDINKSSNSHKLVEYLSTGKVVVANHVLSYNNKRNLIEMLDEMRNDKLPELFKKVLDNLELYNSKELQSRRIEFARDNTYIKQIERIESFIQHPNSISTTFSG